MVTTTTGLLSLSIHEALTFDGTEICLHPDLFDPSPNTGAGSAMTGSTRPSVLLRPTTPSTPTAATLSNASTTTTTPTLPSDGRVLVPTNSEDSRFQGSSTVPQKRMEAGDMIMIRVWDPLPTNERRTGSSLATSTNTNTTTPVFPQKRQPSLLPHPASFDDGISRNPFGKKTSGVPSTVASLQYSADSSKSSEPALELLATNSAMQEADALSLSATDRKDDGQPLTISPSPAAADSVPNTQAAPALKTTIASGTPPPIPMRRTQEGTTTMAMATNPKAPGSGPPRPAMVQRSRTLPPQDTTSRMTTPLPLAATIKPRHVRDISDMTAESSLGPSTSTTTLDGTGVVSGSSGLLELGMADSADDGEDEVEDAVLAKIASTHSLSLAWVMLISEKSLTSLKGSARTQVSLLRQVADLYNLSAYDMVTVTRMDRQDEAAVLEEVSADFVIVTIKDQFISRGDMHFFQKSLIGSWIYEDERLNETTRGIKAHAREIRHGNHLIKSGIVTEETKITFRSRSARIIWLIQISSEMWDFACPYESSSTSFASTDEERACEIYFDKFISFVYKIFAKWKELEVTHSLTIIFFSRTFLHSEMAAESDLDSGGFVRRDVYGRLYEDHYRTIVLNEKRTDWDSLVEKIKEEFVAYPFEVGWNNSFGERGRRPSNASQGNVLEAINVTLNLLQFHFLDRDLHRTGNSLVVVSAGSGVFEVDRELAGITFQRMMDNGIGSDMLSLALPPLHIAPFFLYNNDVQAVETRGVDANEAYYEIPHWMHLSFVSYDNDRIEAMVQSGQHSGGVPGPGQRRHCCYKLDGHLEVAGNGFLLPVMEIDDNENAAQLSSMQIPDKAEEQAKPRVETQARQLIADRDFHDILEACKPRDAGHSLPSALAALLKMNKNSEDSKRNELANRLKNAATAGEGDRVALSRPVLKEWGSVDLDSVGARLLRSAKLKLGKRPESPQEGNNSDREKSDWSDNDKLSPASSIASHLSTMLGRSYESMFLMTAKGIDVASASHGVQLQRSPSIEFSQTPNDGPISSYDELSSGDEDELPVNPTSERGDNENLLNEDRLRKLMTAFDSSYFDETEAPLVANASRHRQGLLALAQESDTSLSPSKSILASRHMGDHIESQQGGGLGAALSQYTKVDETQREPSANPGRIKMVGGSGRIITNVNSVRSFSEERSRLLPAGINPLSPEQPPLRLDIPALTRLGGRSYSSSDAYAQKLASSLTSVGSERRVHGLSDSRHRLEALPVTLELLENSSTHSSRQHGGASALKKPDQYIHRHHRGQNERYRRSGAVSRRKKIFNPFRQQDEDEVLSKRSHNRRRWSHVFPLGEVEFKRHSGPLWKSLCQPAILPLTIDYYPTQQELTSTFTFSYHSVSVKDVENAHYSSPSDLLMEMVRQRIVQDYQLVPQSVVKESTRRGEAQLQVRASSRASMKSFGRNFYPSLPTQNENSGVVQKVLSMGHRIQTIVYDPATESITVTRYMQKRAKNDDATYTYRYAMYSPVKGKFCTVVQTFTKYSPPYVWNTLDAILCGIFDKALEEGLRFRRLIFSVLPDRFTDKTSEEEYIGKFRRLLEYLSKLREKDDTKRDDLDIKIISSASTPSDEENSRKGITDSMKRFNVLLRKGKRDPLEWIELAVDSVFDTKRSYRVVFNWLVASSQKVENQVQLLQRRCAQFGLNLVSMTQTSVSRNLFLNPFVVPSIFCVRNKEKADAIEVFLLERDFVRDGMHFTEPNLLDCTPDGDDYDFPKYKNGRRMNISSMQYVHRAGTVSVRLLRDKQRWGLLVAIENLFYTLDNEECQRSTYKILREIQTLETDE